VNVYALGIIRVRTVNSHYLGSTEYCLSVHTHNSVFAIRHTVLAQTPTVNNYISVSNQTVHAHGQLKSPPQTIISSPYQLNK